jgi:membrane protein
MACEPRSWLRRRAVSLLLALVGMGFFGLTGTLGLTTALAPKLVGRTIDILRESGLVRATLAAGACVFMTVFLALVFRIAIRRPGKKRRVWPGAWVSSSMGSAASLLLGYYATHIASYAFFYGGLAAIVVVLLWLWLWSAAILIGAEINLALEDVAQKRLSD